MPPDDHGETRGERRARKLKSKRAAIPKHGIGLRREVADAALRLARRVVRRKRR